NTTKNNVHFVLNALKKATGFCLNKHITFILKNNYFVHLIKTNNIGLTWKQQIKTKKRSFLLKTHILTLQQNKPTYLRIFYNKTNILTLKHVNQGQQCWLDKTTSTTSYSFFHTSP